MPARAEPAPCVSTAGARQIPLIRDYIEEHEQIIDVGDDALRALDRGDVDRARLSLSRMRDILTSHWQGEEAGVFSEMSDVDTYAAYVEVLVGEHRSLAEFLNVFDVDLPALENGFGTRSGRSTSTSGARRTGSSPPA